MSLYELRDFRVQGLWFRVRAYGLGLRVEGSGTIMSELRVQVAVFEG